MRACYDCSMFCLHDYRNCIVWHLLFVTFFAGCRLEDKEPRSLRAHDQIYSGIAHAPRAELGPRYCRHCHGSQLEGGKNGEPSCLQCHGQNWQDIDGNTSRAPDDHTYKYGIFMHHPGNVPSTCNSCHGNTGNASLSTPACLSCHDAIWE